MIGATALAFPLGVLEGDIRGLMGLSLGVSALNASEPSDELVLALVFDVKNSKVRTKSRFKSLPR